MEGKPLMKQIIQRHDKANREQFYKDDYKLPKAKYEQQQGETIEDFYRRLLQKRTDENGNVLYLTDWDVAEDAEFTEIKNLPA